MIVNPTTNRLVKRNGRIGRAILRARSLEPTNEIGNLPPDVVSRVWEFRENNCGRFISDMMVKYTSDNIGTMNAQDKARLKTIVVKTLEEFRSRLFKTHFIRYSFMDDDPDRPPSLSIPLGKRVQEFLNLARSTNDIHALIDLCRQVVNMKHEAVAIVSQLRQYIQYLETHLYTLTVNGILQARGALKMSGAGYFLDSPSNFFRLTKSRPRPSRRRLMSLVSSPSRNLEIEEEKLEKLLQSIHVKKQH